MTIKNVFNNTYGLARSLLALGTLISLIFTSPNHYFTDLSYKIYASDPSIIPNFFYLFEKEGQDLSVVIAVLILLLVISGYLPQLTGILHAWVTSSFFLGSVIIEGGDQISQIITILLIPITIFDRRINHWSKNEYFKYRRPEFIQYFSYSIIVIIQLQMAVIYFFAASEKLNVNEWVDGSALYYWVTNKPFGATDTILKLLSPIISNHILSPILNWATILLEVLLFSAIFMNKSQKMRMLLIGLIFHAVIILIHGLASFFFAMAGGLILYLIPIGENISFARIKLFIKSLLINKYLITRLLIIVVMIGHVSCKGSVPEPTKENSILERTYSYLLEFYYWSDNLPSLELFNPNLFHSPIELMSKVRSFSPVNTKLNIPMDRWSFAVENETWLQLLNGETNDFGLGLIFSNENDLRVSWVQPNSSAGKSKLKRGDRILRLDNHIPNVGIIDKLLETISTAKDIRLEIETEDQIRYEVTISKGSYKFDTIIRNEVIDRNGTKFGYLNIISFSGNFSKDLEPIMIKFKECKIDQLVVDLRYNGGGVLAFVEDLASYIVPEQHTNSIFYKIKYNSRYNLFDEDVYFKVNNNKIKVSKVKFIVGSNTASASETLIHSISTYLDTEIIGQDTHGKLMGMTPKEIGNYTIFPTTFITLNSKEFKGDPTYNIKPTIYCLDDLYHDFDTRERNISIAIDGIKEISKSRAILQSNSNVELLPHQKFALGIRYVPN